MSASCGNQLTAKVGATHFKSCEHGVVTPPEIRRYVCFHSANWVHFQSSPPSSCGSWIINPQELAKRVSSSDGRSENNQLGDFTYRQPFPKTNFSNGEESMDDHTLEELLKV